MNENVSVAQDEWTSGAHLLEENNQLRLSDTQDDSHPPLGSVDNEDASLAPGQEEEESGSEARRRQYVKSLGPQSAGELYLQYALA